MKLVTTPVDPKLSKAKVGKDQTSAISSRQAEGAGTKAKPPTPKVKLKGTSIQAEGKEKRTGTQRAPLGTSSLAGNDLQGHLMSKDSGGQGAPVNAL
ncbi:unnamed protein product [Linum trigynum]|uniref:Uncharacterized protein n=1 Tax=Linum trigynum TaxID=586398 RepID=A0AAV2CL97_9ROSI